MCVSIRAFGTIERIRASISSESWCACATVHESGTRKWNETKRRAPAWRVRTAWKLTPWRREYAWHDNPFKLELQHFGECIRSGQAPITPGREAVADIQLVGDIVRTYLQHKSEEKQTGG